MFPPEQIVCLTEETVETLLSPGRRPAALSASPATRCAPPEARRKEKPRVSASHLRRRGEEFMALNAGRGADVDSDLQADIVGRADPRQCRGARLQPARRRRHSRHDPHARRAGGRGGRRRTRWRAALAARVDAVHERSAAPGRAGHAGLFRGMGRADDLRHRLGCRS